METLVDVLAEALRPWVSQPYALFGYSMGALIAYEVARRLAREGLSAPIHLFVAASRPPHAPPPLGSLSQMDDGALIEEMRRHYSADVALLQESPELRAVALPTLRADLELLERYVHQEGPALTCPLTALGGVEDGLLPHRVLVEWGVTPRPFPAPAVPGRPLLPSGGSGPVARGRHGGAGAQARGRKPRRPRPDRLSGQSAWRKASNANTSRACRSRRTAARARPRATQAGRSARTRSVASSQCAVEAA